MTNTLNVIERKIQNIQNILKKNENEKALSKKTKNAYIKQLHNLNANRVTLIQIQTKQEVLRKNIRILPSETVIALLNQINNLKSRIKHHPLR